MSDIGDRDGGGLGTEGTIPDDPDGVAVGAGEATTFEPEEDPEVAARRDAAVDADDDASG
jgi:hypothetical protein